MFKALRIFATAIAILFSVILLFWLSMPNVNQIKGCMKTSMYQVDLCPQGKSYVRLPQVSKSFIAALLISEDAGFYGHQGFDWTELKLSLEKNFEKKKFARGGSTITQQLAKNAFLSAEKSLLRKVREAYISYQLEQNLSKNEILEKYVNIVEFGPKLYGIKAAAAHYFQKSPSELNFLESAYLVHLLPNPKLYSNTFRKGALTKFSRSRVVDICAKLRSVGKISSGQYEWAKSNLDQFPWRGVYAPSYSEDVSLPNDDPRAFDKLSGEIMNTPPPESEESVESSEPTPEEASEVPDEESVPGQ